MVCGVRELDMTEQLTVPTDVLTAFLGGEYSTPPQLPPSGSPVACAEWHWDPEWRAGESQFIEQSSETWASGLPCRR